MPVIRITQRLTRTIESNVRTVAQKIRKTKPALTIAQGNKILKTFTSQFGLDNPKDFHSSFGTKITCISLSCNEGFFLADVSPISLPVPQEIYEYSRIKIDASKTLYKIPADIVTALVNITEQSEKVEEEYDTLVGTVDKLLRKCTTLKQLIEAWPHIEQFIPENVLEKHRAEEGKRRKKGVYLETDELDKLNQTLLAAQMTT